MTPQRSVDFNGSTAYAQAPHASELNLSSTWTVEAWFKDETPGGYGHSPSSIVIKGDPYVDDNVPFSVFIADNHLFAGQQANEDAKGAYYDLTGNGVRANAWHHVAVTLSGSNRRLSLYLDGVLVEQETLNAPLAATNNRPVTIGRNGGASSPYAAAYWEGKLDDVRIWNVARTSAQIAASYRSELSGPQTGLVANWRFNEGTGTNVADSAGVAQPATLSGGVSWSTEVHP